MMEAILQASQFLLLFLQLLLIFQQLGLQLLDATVQLEDLFCAVFEHIVELRLELIVAHF